MVKTKFQKRREQQYREYCAEPCPLVFSRDHGNHCEAGIEEYLAVGVKAMR